MTLPDELTPQEALKLANKLNNKITHIAKHPNGEWKLFKGKPQLVDFEGIGITYLGGMPISCPIRYSGDWRDSLHSLEDL